MIDLNDTGLDRRGFLRQSACLIGAACLAGNAAQANAAAPTHDAPTLSLAFWDGARFIPADRLPAGDPALRGASVRLRVSGPALGAARRLRALDALYPIRQDGQDAQAVYHAWTDAPQTAPRAAFTLPVAPDGTVRLAAHHGGPTPLVLTAAAAPDVSKLRAGQYVLAVGHPVWAACRLEPGAEHPLQRRTLRGFAPAACEYLVLTVAPA